MQYRSPGPVKGKEGPARTVPRPMTLMEVGSVTSLPKRERRLREVKQRCPYHTANEQRSQDLNPDVHQMTAADCLAFT